MLYIITLGDYELTMKSFESIKNDKTVQVIKTLEIFKFKSLIKRKISKFLHRLNILCSFNFSKNFKIFLKKITEKDSILIWGSISPLLFDFSKYIKTKHKYIWLWNSLFTYSTESQQLIPKLKKYYKIFTFEPNDVRKYKINFKNQFCYDQIKQINNSNYKTDIYFIGQDKSRYNYVEKLYFCLCDRLKCNFKIIKDITSTENHKTNFFSEYINFEENINNISDTRAILEIVQKRQSGLTIRALEALISKRKLITNNKNIIKEPFYSPKNIFILGVNDINKIFDFINKDFDSCFDYSNYLFSNWIKEFKN